MYPLSIVHHHQSGHLHESLARVGRQEPKPFQLHQKDKSLRDLREKMCFFVVCLFLIGKIIRISLESFPIKHHQPNGCISCSLFVCLLFLFTSNCKSDHYVSLSFINPGECKWSHLLPDFHSFLNGRINSVSWQIQCIIHNPV